MTKLYLELLIIFISIDCLTIAKLYVNITGDITLGALFPVHQKGINGENCGKIQLEDGIQPLEAMLYTVQQINQNPRILSGIRLGVLAFDSCDNPNHALQQALNFVKGLENILREGFVAHMNEYREEEFQCSDGSIPQFLGGGFDKVLAVLAAQSNSVTLQVASMLKLFGVPQISYISTTPSHNNKERYPHFFRSIPTDVNQAYAMLEILKEFQWNHVSVIYSDTDYGIHGYENLISLANNYSICFSTSQKIDKKNLVVEDYENIIRTITKETEVCVVLLITEKFTTLQVLEAAKRLGVETKFIWIGSDAWLSTNHREFFNPGKHSKDSKIMTVLEGALAVQPHFKHLSGFDDYFTNLTYKHSEMNPWFRELWQKYHKCDKNEEKEICEDSLVKINFQMEYKHQRYIHFIINAVYAIANALHILQIEVCGKNFVGICERMKHIDSEKLLKYLNTVTLKDEAGNPFQFINNVDDPSHYLILNFQKDENGSYQWHEVGNYTQSGDNAPVLYLDRKKIKYRKIENKSNEIYFPISTCTQICQPSQIKVKSKQDICCWRCQDCGLYQYKVNEHKCEDCESGTRSTLDGKYCIPIEEEFIDYLSPWAVGAMAVASCGILATIFVLSVFWIYSDSPVIKASGLELSSILLVGTLISFLMTFAIVAEPTIETCAITRFGIGLCYTLCYAALVTKTNGIYRIFKKYCNSNKPKYTSPKSQMIIIGILTSIEILINCIWLLKEPISITHLYPSRNLRSKICRGLDDRSYMIGLIYPFILIAICTSYVIKIKKCPDGFNETRHIAFTNYMTMILWLVFVPLYLTFTSNPIRVITLALSLSLSGLVQLGCLFFPKIYIILMKPEKNTKEMKQGSSCLPTSSAPVVVLNGNAIKLNIYSNKSSLRSSTENSSALNFYESQKLLDDSNFEPSDTVTKNSNKSEMKTT